MLLKIENCPRRKRKKSVFDFFGKTVVFTNTIILSFIAPRGVRPRRILCYQVLDRFCARQPMPLRPLLLSWTRLRFLCLKTFLESPKQTLPTHMSAYVLRRVHIICYHRYYFTRTHTCTHIHMHTCTTQTTA